MTSKQVRHNYIGDLAEFARAYLAKWLLWAGLIPIVIDYIGAYLGWTLPDWFSSASRVWLIISAFYAAFAAWREAIEHSQHEELSAPSNSYIPKPRSSELQPELGAIPAPPGILVGRDELKRMMQDKLNANQNISLHGMGGIGKTSLAAAVAWENGQAGKKVFWLKAERRNPDALYDDIARRLGDRTVVHLGLEEKRTRVRELIKQNNIELLVLDDVWNAEAARALEDARPAGCTLMTTGRERTGSGYPFDVTQLTDSDSETLFRYHSGLSDSRIDVKPIISLLSGHPMALEIAGKLAYRKDLKPSQLVKQLNHIGQRVKLLSLGNQARENVWASLLLSIDALPKVPKTVFKQLGSLWSTSVTDEMIGLVANLNSAEIEEVVSVLITDSLFRSEYTGDGIPRYRLHDLTYDVAVVLYKESSSFRDQKNILDACCNYARKYSERSRSAHNKLEAERENLLGATKWASENNFYEQVNQLALHLWTDTEFLRLRGYVVEAEDVLTRGVIAAEALRKSDDKVTQLIGLGIVYRQLGQQTHAIECLESALTLARQIQDPLRESKAVGDLGWAHYRLGNVNEAINYLEEALAAARVAQNLKWEGVLVGTFGRLYTDLGQTNKALSYLERALAIAYETNDQRETERHIGSLGIIYRLKGELDKAVSHLTRALGLSREIGDLRGEGRNLGHLGLATWSKGDIETSLDYLQQALITHRQAGDPRREGYRLKDLGQIYVHMGDEELAKQHLQKATETAQTINDRRGFAEALVGWGRFYMLTRHTKEAVNAFEQALDIHRLVMNFRAESETLLELANIYVQQSQWQTAETYFQQALRIAQTSEDLETEGFCLGGIGWLHLNKDNLALAETYLNQALLVHQRENIKLGMAVWYRYLAHTDERRIHKVREEEAIQLQSLAVTRYQMAVRLYKEIKHRDADDVSILLQNATDELSKMRGDSRA